MLISVVIAVPFLIYLFLPWKKPARYIGAAALIIGAWILVWPGISKDRDLEKGGWHTVGVVSDKYCQRKASWMKYQFHVNGILFTDKAGANDGQCEFLGIGDQVEVTYLVKDPKVNLPAREVTTNIGWGIIFSIMLFFALVWLSKEQTTFINKKRKK